MQTHSFHLVTEVHDRFLVRARHYYYSKCRNEFTRFHTFGLFKFGLILLFFVAFVDEEMW